MLDKLRPRRSGHDYGPSNMDGVAKAYITVCCVWSFLLFCGLAVFLLHRNVDFVRMRNASVVTCAVLMIHVYLVIILCLYPVNGGWPCNLEFWVMSIYFPLGVALFQAQNIRVLSMSVAQKQLMFKPLERSRRPAARGWALATMRRRWLEMCLVQRTYFGIAVAAVIQFIMTATIFFSSRKFHSSFGVTGGPSTPSTCRVGWEWVPSIIWQMSWTYGFGPLVLFQIRKINDVHHWTLQTSLAILASLPGPALWLAAIYSPAFAKVNLYWPPAMWFAPSLMTMEFVMVFFPLLEVYQSSKSRQTTMTAIEEWEKKRDEGDSMHSGSSTRQTCVSDTSSARRSEKYNMKALERTLELNHADLLEYAATREFTGENIIFLKRVREWRESWARAAHPKGVLSREAHRQLFDEAKDIFAANISLRTSEFPINIESRIYFDLDRMFGSAAPSSPSSVVTPFADGPMAVATSDDAKHGFGLAATSTEAINPPHQAPPPGATTPPFSASLAVPATFDERVFDRAERSVKYMVFTNTWVRYITMLDSGSRTSLSSDGSTSVGSQGSGATDEEKRPRRGRKGGV
ncbi:MAG: hypothetical protein M1832_002250 [Thelocarpon impressellum]|nr:MAG: hypothetical protein M1832_002250 [Thelocarpon impressellum]